MDRVVASLLFVLIVAVTGLGVVTWNADRRAHEAASIAEEHADRQACLQRAQATATIALLTPSNRVDAEGRLEAIAILGNRIDEC